MGAVKVELPGPVLDKPGGIQVWSAGEVSVEADPDCDVQVYMNGMLMLSLMADEVRPLALALLATQPVPEEEKSA